MAADKDARAAKFKFRTDGREGKQAGITQRAADFIRIYAGVFSGCSCCCLQQRRGCNYFGPRGEIKRGERNKGAMPRVKDVYGEREYERAISEQSAKIALYAGRKGGESRYARGAWKNKKPKSVGREYKAKQQQRVCRMNTYIIWESLLTRAMGLF